MPRLSFDEPLSEELCDAVADIFPGSLHIRLMGQGGAADAIVWNLARQHGCLVVSKDEDFHRLALLLGAPPKFIWIRLGNCTRTAQRHNDRCGGFKIAAPIVDREPQRLLDKVAAELGAKFSPKLLTFKTGTRMNARARFADLKNWGR